MIENNDFDQTGAAQRYCVVVNHEAQYSVWRDDRDPPLGWLRAGFAGSYDACLDFIEVTWTDMRPASARARVGAEQV